LRAFVLARGRDAIDHSGALLVDLDACHQRTDDLPTGEKIRLVESVSDLGCKFTETASHLLQLDGLRQSGFDRSHLLLGLREPGADPLAALAEIL
jgi:hypothetical protein